LRSSNLPENLINSVLQLKPGSPADAALLTQLNAYGVDLAKLQKAAGSEALLIAFQKVSLVLLAVGIVVFLLALAIPALRAAKSPPVAVKEGS